ncbi:MAG: hypothetical protein GXP25_25605 [Planctomycetes bacterium]|nr:hypothetical protein [Planctomycetota bacterium]
MLNEEDRDFISKRRKLATSWPLVGVILIAALGALVVGLFVWSPMLVNPFAVLSRIAADEMPQSTLKMAAVLLPVVTLFCFAIVLIVLIFVFFAMANERRHLRILDRLEEITDEKT